MMHNMPGLPIKSILQVQTVIAAVFQIMCTPDYEPINYFLTYILVTQTLASY
jgi:hypothetical protein